MISPLLVITVSMIMSATIVLSFLPKILMLSLRRKLVDVVNPRKVHKSTASRLGGVSFFPAIFISSTLCLSLYLIYGGAGIVPSPTYLVGFVAMLMLYIVGVYDDLINLRYKTKFKVQILAATLMVISGIKISFLYGVASAMSIPDVVSFPLTILFIVFIINAINLIDGIDGLASMLSILALTTYGSLFFIAGDNLNAILAFSTVGALLPFFNYNFFGIRRRTKARIFMGDGGALVIGFILSVMSIRLWNISFTTPLSITPELYHILAYTMLFIPSIDVIRVMITRYLHHRPIFHPDKNHIHHRFMACGCSPRKSLLAIIVMQIGFMILNILLSGSVNIIFIFTVDVLMWIMIQVIIGKKIAKTNIKYANE